MTTQTLTAGATAEETQQLGNTPGEAAQPSQTPSEAAGEPSAADLKAEVAQLRQTLKQMEGRTRTGSDPELRAQMDEIRLAQRRQEFREERRTIRESELPEAEQARQLAEVERREKQTEATQSLVEWRQDTLTEMVEDLGASGIPADDPNITEFGNRWVAATTRAEAQKVRREFNRYLISEPAARAKKTADDAITRAEDARKRANQAEGTLLGGARGSPSGGATATNDNVDGLWLKWENDHPNSREKNPYDDAYRGFLAR